jgi:hypothetical protein
VTNYINVICTDAEGTVCENKLFVGSKKAITKAELCFIKAIKDIRKNVDKDDVMSKDDIEAALDNGCYTYNGCTVFLSHPEVKK